MSNSCQRNWPHDAGCTLRHTSKSPETAISKTQTIIAMSFLKWKLLSERGTVVVILVRWKKIDCLEQLPQFEFLTFINTAMTVANIIIFKLYQFWGNWFDHSNDLVSWSTCHTFEQYTVEPRPVDTPPLWTPRPRGHFLPGLFVFLI